MFELNKTINWQPESTGTGRFGNWLENLSFPFLGHTVAYLAR